MIIHVPRAGEVSVVEADNLRDLKVVAEQGMPIDAVAARLVALGRVEQAHVWLDVDALHDAARPGASSADWERDFRAMIDYAAEHGWTDSETGAVRAHLELEGPSIPSTR